MEEIHDSNLYTAATNALASDASSENTYAKICEAAYEYLDLNDFRIQLAETEHVIRKEFGLKTMPSPWRSAKSVVLSALDLGIALTDDNGLRKGKSALQSEIKLKRKEEETPETPADKADKALVSLLKVWGTLSDVERMTKLAWMNETFKV